MMRKMAKRETLQVSISSDPEV